MSQSYWGAQISDIQSQLNVAASFTKPSQLGLGYMWTSPRDSASMEGLGGGLTWAFDEGICDQLLPQFRESIFFGVPLVSCASLRSAIHRAFDTWSDNSARLNFLEVTSECAALNPDGNGRALADCPIAELWVTWLDQATGKAATNNRDGVRARRMQDGGTTNETAAVTAEGVMLGIPLSEAQSGSSDTAALAQSFPVYSSTTFFSNGIEFAALGHGDFIETRRATLSFNPSLCWCTRTALSPRARGGRTHAAPMHTRYHAESRAMDRRRSHASRCTLPAEADVPSL